MNGQDLKVIWVEWLGDWKYYWLNFRINIGLKSHDKLLINIFNQMLKTIQIQELSIMMQLIIKWNKFQIFQIFQIIIVRWSNDLVNAISCFNVHCMS